MLRTHTTIYVVIIIVLLSFFLVPAVAANEILVVAVNQSRVLNMYGVARVAVANPDIADVLVVSGSEVLLIGKTPGMTTLQLWDGYGRQSFDIQVAPNDAAAADEIKTILGIQDLKVSKVGKTIILEGKVDSQYQKNRAEAVAAAYGEKVVNMLEMASPVQVKIEAQVIEIDRSKINNLGIQWGSLMDAFAQGTFGLGQDAVNGFVKDSVLGGLGKYSPIRGILSAMVKNGSARILSQPNVITLSGDKANIMVGGQIPVPVGMNNGQISIEWKDYGIKLDIEPEVNAEGLINSKVKAEVSSLDWNSAKSIKLGTNMEIPPLKVSKAATAISLSSGQTMAIGGLISSQTSKDLAKLPLLGDIPILGNLFKSSSFTRNETELLIFITPTIINPATYLPGATQEMQDFVGENRWGGAVNDGKNQGVDRR